MLERRFACGAFNEVWAGKLGGSKAVAVKTVALDGMTPDHADILKRETEVVVKVGFCVQRDLCGLVWRPMGDGDEGRG